MTHQKLVLKKPRKQYGGTVRPTWRFYYLHASSDLGTRPGEDIWATAFATGKSAWRLTKEGNEFFPLNGIPRALRRSILSWAAEVGLAPGVPPRRPTSEVAAWEANLTEAMIKEWARASEYDGYFSKVEEDDEGDGDILACTIFSERLPEWKRSEVPAVRATSIRGFTTPQEAAEAVGDLALDSLKEFLTALSGKLSAEVATLRETEPDRCSPEVEEAAELIGSAAKEIGYVS